MRNVLTLAIIPLACMGVTILTALVIILALRRGTKKINDQAQEVITQNTPQNNANTRWARGDLQGENSNDAVLPPAMIACPACGGEIPTGSATCTFCGRKLSSQ